MTLWPATREQFEQEERSPQAGIGSRQFRDMRRGR